MSEYVAEIRITRSARGEGDVPVLVAGGSGAQRDDGLNGPNTDEALAMALERAVVVVKGALEAIPGAREVSYARP